MILADALYLVIPLTNSIGNVLLKLSIEEKQRGDQLSYLLKQALGYSTFILVMMLSYAFLLTHDAKFFVLVFSLNYLATLYVSRWFLNDVFTLRDVKYDLLVALGIFVFYWGCVK